MRKLFMYSFIVCAVSFTACRFRLPAHEKIIRSEQMGLWYEITYVDTAGRSLQLFADTIVNHFQQTFSEENNNSAINLFNASEDFLILSSIEKSFFADILSKIEKDTNSINPPDDFSQVSDILRTMYLRNDTLFKTDPAFQFNFSSMADNYLCDTLAGILEFYGVDDYLIKIHDVKRIKGKNFRGEEWE
ncbi:MAG: hypothetical protein ACKVPJ_03165 [Chitinophagales bacterium]